MDPGAASVTITESSEESLGEVDMKEVSESDSTDASTATEPEQKSESGASDKSFPCIVCGKVFDRPSKLERHGTVHTRKPKALHQCQHCE
uniref:C2H2-type domain-containing protein n=3 Tax=Gasterosteus aculeatus TaxID=69293 RepID=G3Q6V2_GASAC